MKNLDPNHIGIILGLFAAVLHLGWTVLVAIGLAQSLLDFIYGIHFLSNPFTVASFDVTRGATLVVVTFIVGYLAGWVFAYIWNMVHERK